MAILKEIWSGIRSIPTWGIDMLWLFKNAKKLRTAIESKETSPPYCPRHDARMEFQHEQRHSYGSPARPEFTRHYQCPICNYTTFTIYVVKVT